MGGNNGLDAGNDWIQQEQQRVRNQYGQGQYETLPHRSHVNNKIDPISDKETIDTELILSDLNSLEKQMNNLRKKIRTEDKELKYQYTVMEKIYGFLSEGKKINEMSNLNDKEKEIVNKLFLITSKPELFVCNVSENDLDKGNEFTKELEKKNH